MRRDAVRVNQWPRYAAAVAALFWTLGMAAGCHLPHAATAPMHTAAGLTGSTSAIGHDVTALAEHGHLGPGSCAPMDHECKYVAQACPAAPDLLALTVFVAVVAMAGSAVWWVVSVSRGPPRRSGLILHRPGRVILARHCIARI
ncbi:hypothetical protein [Mycobacterium sp. 050134]|uniref:hypothetical protein n=1 Tax=Mycobacterium sp. 050134 TaxID=3096111 RepID=UPI002EDB18E1